MSKWVAKKPVLQHFCPLESLQRTSSQSPRIKIYDSSNIHLIDWPDHEDGIYAKNFLLPLLRNGVHHYIDNVRTVLKVLKIDDIVLPITINDTEYDNSYVCSPYTYYFTYAKNSTQINKNPLIEFATKGVFWALSTCYRLLDLNKVVTVNNWLISTNLYPKMTPEQLVAVSRFLQSEFPSHAILFRSIDQETSPTQYQTLKNNHFSLIAAKQIFFTDTKQNDLFERRLYKSDLALLNSCGYDILDSEQLNEREISQLLDLYRIVYGSKDADYYPQMNAEYLKLALKHEILHLKAIKKDGRIDGIVGFTSRNGVMTCPLFGYDKENPDHASLYRILCTILMEEARKNKLLFNQSAGASTYKKIRKAKDSIDFNAVNYNHLGSHRKIPWMIIKMIFNTIGLRCMKKY